MIRLVIAAWLVLGSAAVGQSDGDWWKVAPPRDGPMTAEDRRAHKMMVELIEKEQTPEFRKWFRVVVPEEPTGLPENYDILLYGRYGDVYLMRLEIRIRGKEATGELVTTDGFYRGPLPAEQIDDPARQLSYGFQSRTELKVKRGMLGGGGALGDGFGRNFRGQHVELISRDPARPFHLQTEAWQRCNDSISDSSDGVEEFAHTRFSEEVEELAREKLTLLEPTAKLHRELVDRLRRIEVPKAVITESETEPPDFSPDRLPLEHYDRHDRPSIEARLYSRLAVYWHVEEALPELLRLKLSGAVTRLRIVTADDPTELLQTAILTKDEEKEEGQEEDKLSEWATEYAGQLPLPKGAEVLLYALPRADTGCSTEILYSLMQCQLDSEHLAAIDAFYSQAIALRSKVAAAECLLHRTHRDEYYLFLLQWALKAERTDDKPYYSITNPYYAARVVLSYSIKHGRRRNESAKMVRTLLGRIPIDAPSIGSNTSTLVAALGDLGGTNDLELLLKYYEQRRDPIESGWNSIASEAIIAIAKIDAELGLEKVHAEIRRYLEEEGERLSFHDCVRPYLGLIFWQDDRSALKLLEPALAKCRRQQCGWGTWTGDAEALVPYLKAETVEQRLKHALPLPQLLNTFCQRPRDMDQWTKDVGLRLIRQGADPKQCQPLLEPEKHRPPGPSSREEESWVAEYAQ
ncbi:MAG: hypothetical protein HQ581_23210 [Planctomycetes bacterium]|nr:hypothetical protein [Planctomycetota bacterium]